MTEEKKTTRITGIGSALVDLLIHEKDDFLETLGKEKGGMTYVTDEDIRKILDLASSPPLVVSGGAACNTIVGVGRLGGAARFIGMRGEDSYGRAYEEGLSRIGIETEFDVSATPTGKVLSVITPDAQRSMFTCLGAATEMAPDKIRPAHFRDTAIAVIEGYLLFNPDLMRACLESAAGAGAKIALDLASFEVVEASREILPGIIETYVDILIANEDEALAYTGIRDEVKALEALSANVSMAVLKVGKEGSFVMADAAVTRIEPVRGNAPVDTTGAGDLWAAGFLYGIANGYSIPDSGTIASHCGYEVCQVNGAHIPEEGWARIRKLL